RYEVHALWRVRAGRDPLRRAFRADPGGARRRIRARSAPGRSALSVARRRTRRPRRHARIAEAGRDLALRQGRSMYAQYAPGYRAPTPSQVNQGFENQVANYRSIGNPDLKPETSRTLEVGVRGRADRFTWDLVGFDGRYRDFIAQIQT